MKAALLVIVASLAFGLISASGVLPAGVTYAIGIFVGCVAGQIQEHDR